MKQSETLKRVSIQSTLDVPIKIFSAKSVLTSLVSLVSFTSYWNLRVGFFEG